MRTPKPLRQELLHLHQQGRAIHVGVHGAGWMGSGFVAQVERMPGMQVSALASADVADARRALVAAGIEPDQIIETDRVGAAADALRSGRRVATSSCGLLAELDAVDIVADVTASAQLGASTAAECIRHGRDVVLVNVEADATVGRILHRRAQRAGVIYTVSSGDEPGCIQELYDHAMALGLEPIAVGKGKNNPLDPLATPQTVSELSSRSGRDPVQVASYVDGTKTMIEMACAANATGCRPIRRGMLGPVATRDTISSIFALESDGGISPFPGVVDYVQGPDLAGGVFVTVRALDPRLRSDLEYLGVGRGNYFTLIRPYHLWFVEAPLSVARAHLHRHATLVPGDRPSAEVLTVAKRSLRAGDRLDGIGGYTYRGVLDSHEAAVAANALPVGLAEGACVLRDVAAGEALAWGDVELDEGSTIVQLRREQDELDAGRDCGPPRR